MKFLAWIAVLVLVFSVAMVAVMLIGRTLPVTPVMIVAAAYYVNGDLEVAWYDLHDINGGRTAKLSPSENARGITWAPDGQVAFIRTVGDTEELVVQDGDHEWTTSFRNAYNSAAVLTWSPGGRLAFVSGHSGGELVYIRERDGTVRQVTASPNRIRRLTWLFHDQLAIVTDSVFHSMQIAIVGIDRAFRTIPDVFDAAWSWNGRLATVTKRQDSGTDIQVIEPGGGTLSITDDTTFDDYPTWSWDGRLAWVSWQAPSSEIMVWNGSEILNISNHPAKDQWPEWTPDGRLLFHSGRDNNSEIYLWDGQSLYNLTQRPEHDFIVGWWYPP